MKTLTLLLSLFFSAATLFAQDINAIIKEGDRLEALPDEVAAFKKFKEALKIQAGNIYALTRCSELCSRIGKRAPDSKTRDDYYKGAKIYAETALKLNAASSDANCVMAIAMGRISLTKSGKEKITTAKEIKKYAELAIKYNAANFKAWHVLGKWHYEISSLSFFERTAAKVFFGGVPTSSYTESINAYEKAKQLDPAFVLNYLELAKSYKRNSQKDKAIATLKTMLTLQNRTEDDPLVKAEGKSLLKEWE
jgi:tetratricopeptide (TPR) repeat protein